MRRWDDDLSDIHDSFPATVGSIDGLTRENRQVVTTAAGARAGEQERQQRWKWRRQREGQHLDEKSTYHLKSIMRFEADDEAGENDSFLVVFTVAGAVGKGEMEIFVPPVTDEAALVAMAMHGLHATLEALARATEERKMPGGEVVRN